MNMIACGNTHTRFHSGDIIIEHIQQIIKRTNYSRKWLIRLMDKDSLLFSVIIIIIYIHSILHGNVILSSLV